MGRNITIDLDFQIENIGVKVAGLKERPVQQCLNCERPVEDCNGCPIYERERPTDKR